MNFNHLQDYYFIQEQTEKADGTAAYLEFHFGGNN